MMTVNIFIKDCMIVYFLICLRMKLEKEVPGLELDVLDGVLVGEEEGEQGDVQGNTDHQVGDVHLERRCSQSGFLGYCTLVCRLGYVIC